VPGGVPVFLASSAPLPDDPADVWRGPIGVCFREMRAVVWAPPGQTLAESRRLTVPRHGLALGCCTPGELVLGDWEVNAVLPGRPKPLPPQSWPRPAKRGGVDQVDRSGLCFSPLWRTVSAATPPTLWTAPTAGYARRSSRAM